MKQSTNQAFRTNPNPLATADLARLRRALGAGPVLIFAHHNPDPDALAAGAGLAYLLEYAWGMEARKVFSGLVARAENVAMLRHLTPGWSGVSTFDEVTGYGSIALVDTQPGAGNNILPAQVTPAAVFDHHQPIRRQVDDVPYLDLRPGVGATSTLIYQHLEAAELSIPPRLATALFYGIKTDTRGLSRGATAGDEIAYVRLLAHVDREALLLVEHARRPAVFFQALQDGLAATQIHGSAVIANLGEMHRSDFAAELADTLIVLDGARGVLCTGRHRGVLQLSVRTVPLGEDAGLLVQDVVRALGDGGGHGVTAGGQVLLSGKGPAGVEAELTRRFLSLLDEENTPGTPLIR